MIIINITIDNYYYYFYFCYYPLLSLLLLLLIVFIFNYKLIQLHACLSKFKTKKNYSNISKQKKLKKKQHSTLELIFSIQIVGIWACFI